MVWYHLRESSPEKEGGAQVSSPLYMSCKLRVLPSSGGRIGLTPAKSPIICQPSLDTSSSESVHNLDIVNLRHPVRSSPMSVVGFRRFIVFRCCSDGSTSQRRHQVSPPLINLSYEFGLHPQHTRVKLGSSTPDPSPLASGPSIHPPSATPDTHRVPH